MTKYEELIEKLKVLFELDKADLDFGIHRIIKSRHREILRYLQGETGYDGPMLKRKVIQVLGDLQAAGQEDEFERLRTEIVEEFGRRAFNEAGELVSEEAKAHDLGRRWMVLQDGQGHYGRRSMDQLETEVYSHLLEFFGRYYEEGDFISLRRTRAGAKPYAIPYSGEEVVLHWANKDQYYIKSSEDLKDYTFTVEEMGTRFRIHFKCARMDPVANNNKAHRAFVLDEEAEIQATEDALVIPFYFKIFERKPTEKQQVEALEESLTAALGNEWKTRLNQQDTTYTGSGTRTLLQKHLQNYTRKNTTDYFIHKDLGGFLKQELDFFIKNEVMYLDDVDNRPADYLTAEVRKIKAIRSVAKDLIDFLAQFENFQKRLWLKKKFVTECHYCITLDRIIEHAPELLPEIAANEEQRKEWVNLYAIDEIRAEELGQVAYSEPLTVEFLRANSFLMVDTAMFSSLFKRELIAAIDDMDAFCDGTVLHSENLQALLFLERRYARSVDCIYIDPPYNTDASPILYKNSYKSSTWQTLMQNRLIACRPLLKRGGVLAAAIDDEQYKELGYGIREVFNGLDLGTIVVRSNPSGRPMQSGYSVSHEYVIFAGADRSSVISRMPPTEDQMARFNQRDEIGPFEWRNLRREGSDSDRDARRSMYYPLFIENGQIRVPQMHWNEDGEEWILDETPSDSVQVVYPDNENGDEKRWRWEKDTVSSSLGQLGVRPDRSGNDYVYYKRRPNEKGVVCVSSWLEAKYSSTEHGSAILKALFGRSPFSYPKSLHAVTDSIYVSGAWRDDAIVLDFFAGSATTAHSVISLNRSSGCGRRKYLLAEMGDYFDKATLPRIKKVVYSPDWQDGKPSRRDAGISHCFKFLRLESYEDTLNNLELEDRSADILGLPTDVQEDYLIRYMLDIETRDSLMNLQRFADPWGCTLKIYDRKSGEARPKVIDMVETFNYLLGLRVREQKVREGFLTVEGENPFGETVLVIWRKLSGESDWPTTDNTALNAFVADELRVNPADTEYAAIYINGDTTLVDPHKKILLTEQVFHELMFADAD